MRARKNVGYGGKRLFRAPGKSARHTLRSREQRFCQLILQPCPQHQRQRQPAFSGLCWTEVFSVPPTPALTSSVADTQPSAQLLALRNASLIQRLSSSLPSPPPSTDTKALTSTVITYALSLLRSIHAAATASAATASASPQTAERLVNASDPRTITCLLDLLVLEGIYPSLSTGVGIPIERRARNFVLPATRKKVQEVGENKNVELLGKVVDGLIRVMEGEGAEIGVGGTVKERCLVDVLAGCGELAFVESGETVDGWKERWEMLVNRFVRLFLTFMAEHASPLHIQPCFPGICVPCTHATMLLYSANAPIALHGISLGLIFLSKNTHPCSPPFSVVPPPSPDPICLPTAVNIYSLNPPPPPSRHPPHPPTIPLHNLGLRPLCQCAH